MGYEHKTVCYSDFEYAREEMKTATVFMRFVNTMEGFWSLLRSWLRRGISQEKLPLYLGFFECLHNLKKGGKA